MGSAISGIMNGAASVKAGKSFFDGFASGVEEGAIIGALCGMFGAGTAVMMTGAEMTVGNVFAARVINAVGDATIGTATYIYHENKYDKAITGGDVAKTWAECAITSFVLRSVLRVESHRQKQMERIGVCLLAKDGWSLKVVLLVRPAMGSQGK